jgi:hypothetical protein
VTLLGTHVATILRLRSVRSAGAAPLLVPPPAQWAPKPGEKPPEDPNQLVLWQERMKEFERWSTHLFDASKATLPFQTPSLRSILLDDKREEKLPDAKRVLSTMEEVRQRMIEFGIQPDAFARALLAKTIDIEALEEEEEQRARRGASPMNVQPDQVLERMPGRTAEEYDKDFQQTTQSDFGQFRQYIRPRMLWGWWTEEAARRLTRFYEDFAAGKRPKLALMAPPQTGKSWMVTDFIAWCAGKNPDKKTIFGSFSDDLGIRTNSDLQHIFTGDRFRRAFPDTRIAVQNTILDRWKRNSSLIEFVDHDGSFRNTTVAGQINGMELHLGVIDDPVKVRGPQGSHGRAGTRRPSRPVSSARQPPPLARMKWRERATHWCPVPPPP